MQTFAAAAVIRAHSCSFVDRSFVLLGELGVLASLAQSSIQKWRNEHTAVWVI
jgi:hypothetical protein